MSDGLMTKLHPETQGHDRPSARPISEASSPTSQAAILGTPVHFDDYLLLKRIALGSAAEIFLAAYSDHSTDDHQVALKRIHPDLSNDDQFAHVFIDEIKFGLELHHPNIVSIHDVGFTDGQYFLSMEYVEGYDLAKVLATCDQKKIEIPSSVALYVVLEALKGLDYIHNLEAPTGEPYRIVHLNICPSSILLSSRGDVKVTDLGLANAYIRSKTGKQHHTTLSYKAPEQTTRSQADQRSDIFSIGILLYELLSGHQLRQAYKSLEYVDTELSAIENYRPDIHRQLSLIIQKATKKAPEERFSSIRELSNALDTYIKQASIQLNVQSFINFLKSIFRDSTEDQNNILQYSKNFMIDTDRAGSVPSENISSNDSRDDFGQNSVKTSVGAPPQAESPSSKSNQIDHGSEQMTKSSSQAKQLDIGVDHIGHNAVETAVGAPPNPPMPHQNDFGSSSVKTSIGAPPLPPEFKASDLQDPQGFGSDSPITLVDPVPPESEPPLDLDLPSLEPLSNPQLLDEAPALSPFAPQQSSSHQDLLSSKDLESSPGEEISNSTAPAVDDLLSTSMANASSEISSHPISDLNNSSQLEPPAILDLQLAEPAKTDSNSYQTRPNHGLDLNEVDTSSDQHTPVIPPAALSADPIADDSVPDSFLPPDLPDKANTSDIKPKRSNPKTPKELPRLRIESEIHKFPISEFEAKPEILPLYELGSEDLEETSPYAQVNNPAVVIEPDYPYPISTLGHEDATKPYPARGDSADSLAKTTESHAASIIASKPPTPPSTEASELAGSPAQTSSEPPSFWGDNLLNQEDSSNEPVSNQLLISEDKTPTNVSKINNADAFSRSNNATAFIRSPSHLSGFPEKSDANDSQVPILAPVVYESVPQALLDATPTVEPHDSSSNRPKPAEPGAWTEATGISVLPRPLSTYGLSPSSQQSSETSSVTQTHQPRTLAIVGILVAAVVISTGLMLWKNRSQASQNLSFSTDRSASRKKVQAPKEAPSPTTSPKVHNFVFTDKQPRPHPSKSAILSSGQAVGQISLRCTKSAQLHLEGWPMMNVAPGSFNRSLPAGRYSGALKRRGKLLSKLNFKLSVGTTLILKCPR